MYVHYLIYTPSTLKFKRVKYKKTPQNPVYAGCIELQGTRENYSIHSRRSTKGKKSMHYEFNDNKIINTSNNSIQVSSICVDCMNACTFIIDMTDSC